jgi:hypothetical protein
MVVKRTPACAQVNAVASTVSNYWGVGVIGLYEAVPDACVARADAGFNRIILDQFGAEAHPLVEIVRYRGSRLRGDMRLFLGL